MKGREGMAAPPTARRPDAQGYSLLRHALGVQRIGDRWRKPYRNYFVAGARDAATWRDLVSQGLARLVGEGRDVTGGDPVFVVTDKGRAVALAGIAFKRVWGYGSPTYRDDDG